MEIFSGKSMFVAGSGVHHLLKYTVPTNVIGQALPIKLVGLAIVWLVNIVIPLKVVGRLANISRHFL